MGSISRTARAMILMNYENHPDYETWYFYDLTEFGLNSERWIIIEPKYGSLAVLDRARKIIIRNVFSTSSILMKSSK
jgi:hypothetical protein